MSKIYPIYEAEEIIIKYTNKPIDIVNENPKVWEIIKTTYIVVYIFSVSTISKIILNKIEIKPKIKTEDKEIEKGLKLLIGYDEKEKKKIYLPETGLYQNFLITGTIGSGKTSSAM